MPSSWSSVKGIKCERRYPFTMRCAFIAFKVAPPSLKNLICSNNLCCERSRYLPGIYVGRKMILHSINLLFCVANGYAICRERLAAKYFYILQSNVSNRCNHSSLPFEQRAFDCVYDTCILLPIKHEYFNQLFYHFRPCQVIFFI